MSVARKVLVAAGGLVLIGIVTVFSQWYLPTRRAVDIGAGMLAKTICSCLYVANRELDDCRADQFPEMDPIRVEASRDEYRVRAWVPGLGERSAIYREGFGCSFE